MNRILICATLLVIAAVIVSGQSVSSDWPQWRGPDRTGVSKETGLLDREVYKRGK